MAYSLTQQKALVLAPKFSAALSTAGSGWIMWQVLRDKRKHSDSYHRIVFGLSAWDAWRSFFHFMSSWPTPVGSAYGAMGNTATCTAQGFGIQVGLGATLYNGVQAAYYLATIRYGMSQTTFRLKYERWCHILVNVISLALCLPSLMPGLRLYNPAGIWCFIAPYPMGCTQSYERIDGTTPCTRGDNAFLYRMGLFYVPLWACIIFNIVATILIYLTVRQAENRSNKWATASGGSPNYVRSNQVAHQAMFYIFAFLLTWTFPTIHRMLSFADRSNFWISFGHAFLDPGQGFYNFFCLCTASISCQSQEAGRPRRSTDNR